MIDGDFLWGLTFALSVFGAALALPVTWLLLRRYRKSVIRHMNQRSAADTASTPFVASASQAERHPVSPDPQGIARGARRNIILVIAIGLLTGLGYATLYLTWNDMMSLHDLIFFTMLYSWVTVLGVWIVTRGARRWVWGSVGVYFALLVIEDQFAEGPPLNFLAIWVWYLIPTAAVILFLSRPLRGVGTLVLGAMMAAILGFFGVVGSDPLLLAWVELALGLGISDVFTAILAIQVAGFLIFLAVATGVVWLLSHWYRRNGFSDQMLLLGSVFLVFALDSSTSISSANWAAFGVGLLVYVGIGVIAYFSWLLLSDPPAPSGLLMLRVFSPRPQGYRLLDAITARWRHLGPVRMIGGPDLAVASVEPDEFLTFVSGRLRRLFIDSAEALSERMRSLDSRADPDGRYRVEEFFCFDDTWRPTVTELLRQSDAVIMDLRGFGPDNQGCIDEIELLKVELAMPRTVLLVDSETDRPLLDSALGTADDGPTLLMIDADADPDDAVMALITATAREPTAPGSRFSASD